MNENWISVLSARPIDEEWKIVWDADNRRSKPAKYIRGEWQDVFTKITHWMPFPTNAPTQTINIE